MRDPSLSFGPLESHGANAPKEILETKSESKASNGESKASNGHRARGDVT